MFMLYKTFKKESIWFCSQIVNKDDVALSIIDYNYKRSALKSHHQICC